MDKAGCHAEEHHNGKECKKTGESEELCARRLRYEFFESLETDFVATAHTASDNAETMLFNLSRGSGLKGLSGIPCQRGRYIRPMLEITRAEVEDYCSSNSLDYMTDSTNLSDDYTRNYIRNNIIPQLKEVNSAFEQNAARAAELLRADAQYLEAEAEKEFKRLASEKEISLDLGDLHPALRSRVVALFLQKHLGEAADSLHIKAVEDLILKGSGVVQLKFGFEAQAARGKLWIFKRQDSEEFCIPIKIGLNIGENYSFEVCSIPREDITDSNKINKLLLNGAIDCDKIIGKLVVRSRQEGDSLRPVGRGITKSLKNLFAESDIPMERRGSYPLLADDQGLVWFSGQRVAERAAVDAGSKNAIFIKDFKVY